jgi:hypothetical protein
MALMAFGTAINVGEDAFGLLGLTVGPMIGGAVLWQYLRLSHKGGRGPEIKARKVSKLGLKNAGQSAVLAVLAH